MEKSFEGFFFKKHVLDALLPLVAIKDITKTLYWFSTLATVYSEPVTWKESQ